MDHIHTFSMQAMVRGYHVYKLIWDAACDDDILPCKREIGNPHDPYSVAVKKRTVVVGHMLRDFNHMFYINKPAMFATNYYHRRYKFSIQRSNFGKITTICQIRQYFTPPIFHHVQ